MGKIDIIELATFCTNRHKESVEGDTCRYSSTLFVKITDDDSITISTTPHFLYDAVKCVLVHERYVKAVSKWHYWYHVEVINNDGEVLDGKLDDEFELKIDYTGNFDNQRLYLSDVNNFYYDCPWQVDEIKKVWSLYLRLRTTKNKEERKLISQLYKDDNKILDMESEIECLTFQNELLRKEKEMYKELIDHISTMFSNNQ